MTDDIPSMAEALDAFRRERSCQIGETTDDLIRRIRDRVSQELHYLRDRIVELGTSEIPDHEVKQQLARLAKGILIRRAAYAEWRKEYRASIGAPAGP
jgi:hypothetical protein